jgi:hypothetical protein
MDENACPFDGTAVTRIQIAQISVGRVVRKTFPGHNRQGKVDDEDDEYCRECCP